MKATLLVAWAFVVEGIRLVGLVVVGLFVINAAAMVAAAAGYFSYRGIRRLFSGSKTPKASANVVEMPSATAVNG